MTSMLAWHSNIGRAKWNTEYRNCFGKKISYEAMFKNAAGKAAKNPIPQNVNE